MKKVIIIDDSTTSLNLLKGKFISADWNVFGTSSAKDGFNMVFDIAPDLIVTDAIMPFIGGFQFVKMLRDNPATALIPVIIYSVLPENRAKYYIKDDCMEFFISKDDNVDKLISLSEKLIQEHRLDESYKQKILKSKPDMFLTRKEPKIIGKLEQEEKFDPNKLQAKFKEKLNSNYGDEKLFGDFFGIIYPALKYDLCVVFPHWSSDKGKRGFFDIRDILLSRVFQNKMLEKYGAKDPVLYKKYAPKLKTINSEDDFNSKMEFNFEYKEQPLADIILYSAQLSKWDNEDKNIIKDTLFEFFKTYYENKITPAPKKDNLGKKYFNDRFNILNIQEPQNKDKNAFLGILSILNYTDTIALISKEDTDILNSKISETIIKYLTDDEQVIKNDEDEYLIIIQVEDYENAIAKFNFIISSLENIKYDDVSLEVAIGASECNINGDYNLFEAQKNAYKALENTTTTEKTVIYNATE